jgi:hypothetical protein
MPAEELQLAPTIRAVKAKLLRLLLSGAGPARASNCPHNPYLKAVRCARVVLGPSGESRELLACASGWCCRGLQGRFWGDTEVAAPLAIDDCRASAQRVIDHADLTTARIEPRRASPVGRRPPAVIVSGIIDPFRRSHIFAVVGGMMVVSGDVAIKGSSVRRSWVSRAYPPWTKRPTGLALDRVPVC